MKEKAINEILNQWFELKVIKTKEEIRLRHEIHLEKMKKQCEYIRSKYFRHIIMQTFVSDYILYAYYAMNVFIATDSEWEAMANGVEDSRIDELKLYVRSWILYEFKRDFMESDGQIMSINNKEELVKLPVMNFSLVGEENSDEINILDFLTSEDSIFYENVNQIYYKNAFRDWFDENRAKILTKNQDTFITNMNNVNLQEQDNETVRSFVGINKDKVNTKMDGIVDRIVSVYNKQLPKIESRDMLELKARIKLLQPVISLIYSDEENVNKKIWTYVACNIEALQEYLKLSAEEHIAINKNQYDSKLVYKVCEQLEDKLEIYNFRLEKAKEFKADPITSYERFVHKKVERDEDDVEMDVYEIISRDGIMVKKDKEDIYDKPHAENLRTYTISA